MGIPAESLPAEARAERIAELERAISRAFLRATILQTVVIFLPCVAIFLLYLNDTISIDILAPIMIGIGVLMGAFWVVFLQTKLQPLQREIAELERLEDMAAD